jgi:hypothetical protein
VECVGRRDILRTMKADPSHASGGKVSSLRYQGTWNGFSFLGSLDRLHKLSLPYVLYPPCLAIEPREETSDANFRA